MLFLLLVPMLFSRKVHASSYYFDFSTSPYTNSNNELEVAMKYQLRGYEDSRFRIKPVLEEAGAVQIYTDGYFQTLNDWDEMPFLNSELKLRLLSNNFHTKNLIFQIQDIQTAQIYETPKHQINSRLWFSNYLNELNKSLSRMIK
ncbi:hypothetical protein HN803_06495 [candidate division WWE3 bacterium]|jgi:hypothetical protein|nr:hypothetical protein [candidate division WWE3 bacterium]